jgi:CelD/BcsL family acetyltransferase involved in cellulose biosynthesis
MTNEERALWERLAAAQPIADVMASPLGWDAWRRYTRQASSGRLVVARRAGVPIALMPIAPTTNTSWRKLFARRLVSAGDLHWSCRYPITGPDIVGDTRALLVQLAQEGGWDELVLGPMLADGASLAALASEGEALGMRPIVTPTGQSPRTLIRGSWSDFYAARGNVLRADVSRGEKRLAKLGPVRLEHARSGPEVEAALEAFLRIEATGWKLEQGTAIACDPRLRERYVTLARAAEAMGKLHLFVLHAGDHAIAANYCIEHERGLYGLKTGYDAAYAKASPGHVLRRHVLEHMWTTGEHIGFDFMPGGGEHNQHKVRWANDVRNYAEVRLFRPRRPHGQLLALATRAKRAMEARR